MRSRIAGTFGVVVLVSALAGAADLSTKASKRIDASAAVLDEAHRMPDQDVPQDLWDKAKCVIVLPSVKKGAFVLGGEFGSGLMSCRRAGAWSAPVFMHLEKGSVGFQIGGESADLILLVMNERGMEKLLQDKVSLGADASVAAGPVGRKTQAATDAQLHAQILSWSRSRGAFAGIDLSGGVLSPDRDDNVDLYGAEVVPRDVLLGGKEKPPDETRTFMEALRRRDVEKPRG